MEKLGFGLDDDLGTFDPKQNIPIKTRLLSIQRCIKHLIHACECKDVNCRLPSCQRMKRTLQHARGCNTRTHGGCTICKQLTALCCYHAMHCQERKCAVPLCSTIKTKLKLTHLQQKLQQMQISVGHKATMQNRRMSGAVGMNLGNSNSSNPPFSSSQPLLLPQPHQPGIGMMPSTGPHVGILQAVQQAQAARQTVSHMVTSVNSIENSAGCSRVMSNADSSRGIMPGLAWQQLRQQLLQTLKSPPSVQQQQQVLTIMQSSPQLIAAFIKQGTAQQQQQQQ